MREIKFRAWSIEKKRMYEVNLLDTYPVVLGEYPKGLWGQTIYTTGEAILHGSDCELMQFTGLKDKNGKEIYEGDIVKNYSKVIKRGILSKVIWNTDTAEFMMITDLGSYDAMYHLLEEEYEVIGNIYENPELLK